MSDTVPKHVLKPVVERARRIEVFTGAGRRRTWSAEEKAAIVAESYSCGDTVCGVARRHGLTHAQLFNWRRTARRARSTSDVLPFVPAVVEDPIRSPGNEVEQRTSRPARRFGRAPGIVEVEIDGVMVRVGRGAEAKTIAAVIRALKAGS